MLEEFTWFKQSAYLWKSEGLNVYIDPWGITAREKADVILVTHAHPDHFQPGEIEKIRQPKTKIVAPRDVANELKGDVTPIKPGDNIKVGNLSIQAVPAYNVKPERAENHPKSKQWVGYVLTLGGRSIYHAGDTDHAPELNQVKADITFLPIGGHDFTMDVSEAARDQGGSNGPQALLRRNPRYVWRCRSHGAAGQRLRKPGRYQRRD